MTTTDLIIILQDNEKGGISHKPRNISLCINGQYMPNPHISLSSTGDGICGSEIDLDIEGDWFEQQPCEDCISREAVDEYITNLLSGYLYDEERTRLEDLTTYIWELPSVTPKAERWIPCTERLPDKLQDVLVTFYDAEGEYDVAYMRKTFNATYIANGAENEWVSSMGETTYADYEIAAWMPLMPYKAESEDKE